MLRLDIYSDIIQAQLARHATMGRKNRPRRQTDKLASYDSSNDGLDSGGKERYEDRLGSHTVSGRSPTSDAPTAQHSRNNNSPNRPRRPFQVCSHHNPSSNQYASTPRPVDEDAFIVISKRFRQQLLLSIEQTFKHIEQWWRDDDSREDKMDWQPEMEVVLQQSTESITPRNHAWRPASVLEGHRGL